MKKLKLIFSLFCAILFITNVTAQATNDEVVKGGQPDNTALITDPPPSPDASSTVIDTSETDEPEPIEMDD